MVTLAAVGAVCVLGLVVAVVVRSVVDPVNARTGFRCSELGPELDILFARLETLRVSEPRRGVGASL